MVRGPQVMKGYRNMPEKTAEALTEDGWLLTGDVGEFDEAGYLRIVDRKKELIINAAGKNMSPANIEAKLKAASPLIAQVGRDRRPPPLQRRPDHPRPRNARRPRRRRRGRRRSSRRSPPRSRPATSASRGSSRSSATR